MRFTVRGLPLTVSGLQFPVHCSRRQKAKKMKAKVANPRRLNILGKGDWSSDRELLAALLKHCQQKLLAILIILTGAVSTGFAATVINTNDSGPGSLRDAIATTPAGGTVNFALSGCPCTIVLTTGDLAITKDLTVIGPGADQLTISGNNAWRPFRIGAPYMIPTPPPVITVVLDGLRLTNGVAGVWPPFSGLDKYGGGIISVDANLTIRNSIISDNFDERDSAKKPRVTSKLSETGDTYVAYATFASGALALQSNAPVEE